MKPAPGDGAAPPGARSSVGGKYSVDARDAMGVQIGDGNTQIIYAVPGGMREAGGDTGALLAGAGEPAFPSFSCLQPAFAAVTYTLAAEKARVYSATPEIPSRSTWTGRGCQPISESTAGVTRSLHRRSRYVISVSLRLTHTVPSFCTLSGSVRRMMKPRRTRRSARPKGQGE